MPVLGRVLGCASVFAPGEKSVGEAVRRAILTAVADAGLAPEEIGFVAAHGLSTIEEDRFEAQAIHSALGDVPVTAAKSFFGHLGPGAGALESVMSVLALCEGKIPPTLNYERPDPACPVNVVHGGPAALERRTALVLAHTPARPSGGGGVGRRKLDRLAQARLNKVALENNHAE